MTARDRSSANRSRPGASRPDRSSVLIRALLLLFAAALFTAFIALGLWQSSRAEQKVATLAAFERALATTTPEPLSDALVKPADVPRRVSGALAMRPDLPWLLLDNQRRGNQVGVIAYSVADPGAGLPLLLVEFGWLPLPPDRALPALPPPSPQLALDGMLLAPPSAGLRFGTHQYDSSSTAPVLLTYLDPTEIAAWLQHAVYPQVLRPNPDAAIGFARDLAALPNTLSPDKHRGYAVQWFGLAIAVLIVTLILLLRSRHP